ncbi:MAG: SpoIID/LytB domain-containing protein [Bacillota bacterium]|nr:SpoIID/LytB domain-containing protein [Bacillota bacterium]
MSKGTDKKKKGMGLLTAFLLFTALLLPASFAYGADSVPDHVTVGLKYGSTAASTFTFTSDSGFQLASFEKDTGFSSTLPLPAYTAVVASVEGGKVALRDENGILLTADIGKSGCLLAADHQNGGSVALEGYGYRGGLMLQADENGRISVVNCLGLEEYLYGVLNNEMSYAYPMEALKAQAVAARSYAVTGIGSHASSGFDLCTSTHCQVYSGVRGEHSQTTAAVDATAGLALHVGGEIVQANYHANSGGYTSNSEDVWSAAVSHLRAVEDGYSPLYSWQHSYTFAQLQELLEGAGYDPGEVEAVSITGRTSYGSVLSLEIKGSRETVALQKSAIRSVLGAGLVKSLRFDISSDGSGQGGESGLTASSGTAEKALSQEFYIISEDGSVSLAPTAFLYVKGSQDVARVSNSSLDTVEGEQVVFTGTGYGHGVGMSQQGARAMAEEGFSFEDILHFYYTGVEIR